MTKIRTILLSLTVAISCQLNAQILKNLEFTGGWAHVSGNNGLDGFNGGASVWFTKRVSVGFDYDHTSDTNALSNFGLTNIGLITVKSRMQDWMVGPRFFFHSTEVKVLHTLHPFAEVEFGASHLNTTVTQVGLGSQEASDNSGTWLLGGGGDVLFSPHWAGRINLGLQRTHFAESAQSRLRLIMGVAYTFGSRKVKWAALMMKAAVQRRLRTAAAPRKVNVEG
jgi:hypothetical protein